ncbi:MAG TPA: response regulator [Ignavibacteriales bacterium]|nr:response regulator [Ignavibacteriales bacterium]HOL80552.1 response regulator [Ignavibacteriales bacterium]HOM64241.1 response regulator [Ignavibacteriales bacterium]HPD67285.1 response regulator [Ignavibacteriales bacterium]HPP33113.1 response regulator [Ignavibacteriales bacterium]
MSNHEVNLNKGLNILIVEDDEISRVLLENSLKKLANNIYIATNGEEAIELAKNHDDIDVILMDMGLPKINGYEATKEIRKFNSDILIIAQTAYALSNEKELAIDAGCNLFLSKPININELKEILNQKFKNKLL